MDKDTMIIGLIALVVGGVGGYALSSQIRAGDTSEDSMTDMHHGMQDEMGGMMQGLEGKTGDEFDKAFLAEMIMHHEGAVDMAHAALAHARHEEIKDMANAIISAQTAEINQMKSWQVSWYGN